MSENSDENNAEKEMEKVNDRSAQEVKELVKQKRKIKKG